jgi:hypothetical protein
MAHPYSDLSARAFWRSGVAQADKAVLADLYRPSFEITHDTAVATAGSCFAQHIGTSLRRAGCTVLDAEPVPPEVVSHVAQRYGYGLFSGRYGNIYTSRQMLQLLQDAATGTVDACFAWEKDGRFFDAFRPTVEPDGLASVDEVLLHREYHLERTAQMLRQADVFVFTLGLTETWVDRRTGRAFGLCPGVAAGQFDADAHVLFNLRYGDVLADLKAIHALLQRFRPGMKLLLTVSPVPLTATASGDHVLSANTWSKATLRSAAGDFVADTPGTAYFPSFEIITSHATGGPWFEDNLRAVRPDGVARVMSIFLAAHGLTGGAPGTGPRPDAADNDDDDPDDPVCDELLLQAFSK